MQIKDSWILSTLLENTGDSIYIKDRECRLWLVSRKMASSLNVNDPTELYGKTDIELFGKEFGGKTMQDDLDVMNKGEPLIGVVERFIREDGGINWTSTTKFPLRNDQGEIIGLMGITRDTVIKLAQNELGIETVERRFDRSELYAASKCFLTGTAANITPVAEIDRRQVGNGEIGEITRKLQELYFDVIAGKNPRYLEWCTPVYRK